MVSSELRIPCSFDHRLLLANCLSRIIAAAIAIVAFFVCPYLVIADATAKLSSSIFSRLSVCVR